MLNGRHFLVLACCHGSSITEALRKLFLLLFLLWLPSFYPLTFAKAMLMLTAVPLIAVE